MAQAVISCTISETNKLAMEASRVNLPPVVHGNPRKNQLTGRPDLCGHIRNLKANGLVFGDGHPEPLAFPGILD